MMAGTVIQIDPQLDRVDDSYLRCRSYGHGFEEFAPVDLYPPLYGWRLSLRCIRCTTERHDNYDFKGKLMGRRYIYPDGYQQKGVPKVIFREALFSRIRAKLEKSNQLGEDVPEPTKTRRKRAAAKA